jgi:dynactin complex subunit
LRRREEMAKKKDDEMVSLRETSDRLVDIFLELEESGGELTPELEADLAKYTENRKVKAERIILFSRRMKAQAMALKSETAGFLAMAAKKTKAADNIERYLLAEMQALNEKKIHTEMFTITRARIGIPKIDTDVSVGEVPRKFIRIIPEERRLDKKVVLAIMKASKGIPDEPGVYEVELEGCKFSVVVSERLAVS